MTNRPRALEQSSDQKHATTSFLYADLYRPTDFLHDELSPNFFYVNQALVGLIRFHQCFITMLLNRLIDHAYMPGASKEDHLHA